jgi:serine protease Do
VRVFGGSPADRAGLRAGDVITAVAGRPVDSREAFSTYTSTLAAGQPVDITVQRGGSPRTVQARPADPPADLGLRILREVAGLSIADQQRTVIIDDVLANTRASEIGLQPGDMIVAINGREVNTTVEANTELIRGAERSSIVLSVARGRYVYNLTFPMGL